MQGEWYTASGPPPPKIHVPRVTQVVGVSAKSALVIRPPAPKAVSVSKAGRAAPGKQATAFAVLPTENGPVLAPPHNVTDMLRHDWALFLELATYCLYGHMEGKIAFGIEEVAEAISQAAVAVLFVPVSCGHAGEQSVRGVAMCGGRGYIVGSAHELFEDIDDWGAVAILSQPLARILPSEKDYGQPPEKRQKLDGSAVLGAATAKSAAMVRPSALSQAEAPPPVEATQRPPVSEKELLHELKVLGTKESLADKTAIPRVAALVREEYLSDLTPQVVFDAFHDIFSRLKGVAHRKALVYVIHELFMGKKGLVMKEENCRSSCLERFLLRIGATVKAFKSVERRAYIKAASAWADARVLLPTELVQLKDSWDMD